MAAGELVEMTIEQRREQLLRGTDGMQHLFSKRMYVWVGSCGRGIGHGICCRMPEQGTFEDVLESWSSSQL
jgi:hypothetical protein